MLISKKILSLILTFGVCSVFTHSYASESNSETILPANFCANSQLDITQNPYSINKKLPYQIVLKCTNNNQVIQTPIQQNIPSNSEIAFTVPYIIGQQYYLFIIVKTHQIDAQKQTNGYAYKLYAFTLNNNILQPADNFLTRNQIDGDGFEGTFEGKQQTYATLQDIKNYFTDKTQLSIIEGPFSTALCHNCKIYFQTRKQLRTDPIDFMIEYKQNGKIRRELIDQYKPYLNKTIYSVKLRNVFTHLIQGKPYIFVIISWSTSSIISTTQNRKSGDLYQIYSYTTNQNGKLQRDPLMMADPKLRGFDGVIADDSQAEKSDVLENEYFSYIFPQDLTKYLDQIYNFALFPQTLKTNLYPEGKCYFQAQKSNYLTPINFILEYKENGQIKKEIIDQYQPKETAAAIASIFSYSINGRQYIFTNVAWPIKPIDKNYKYGNTHEIYAYTKDQNGKLKRDQNIMNDFQQRDFTGIDEKKGEYISEFNEYNDKGLTKNYCDYTLADCLKKYLEYKYKIRLSTE